MELGFSTWALLLIASALVIVMERRNRPATEQIDVVDQAAAEAVTAGQSAAPLSGRWEAQWYVGEGAARIPYASNQSDEITLCASGARVFCSSFDKSTGRTYWLQGHYSDRDILTLHYWSRPEKGVCSLTGVVLLKVEYNFQEANLQAKGWWRAYTRENTITSGETDWKRLG